MSCNKSSHAYRACWKEQPDGDHYVSIVAPWGAYVDELGRLIRMRDALGMTSHTYNGAGRLTGFVDPNGFALGYIYDEIGNVTRLTYPDGSSVG